MVQRLLDYVLCCGQNQTHRQTQMITILMRFPLASVIKYRWTTATTSDSMLFECTVSNFVGREKSCGENSCYYHPPTQLAQVDVPELHRNLDRTLISLLPYHQLSLQPWRHQMDKGSFHSVHVGYFRCSLKPDSTNQLQSLATFSLWWQLQNPRCLALPAHGQQHNSQLLFILFIMISYTKYMSNKEQTSKK